MMEVLRGKNLLIVEDEPDLREPIREELEYFGANVFQAKNGVDAMTIVRRESLHTIITDVRMPGGGGVELLKKVKAIGGTYPLMMLITGFSDLSHEEAYHLGAECILPKPFDLDALTTSLARILTTREERWAAGPGKGATGEKIVLKYPEFAVAVSAGQLGVGRGGLFFRKEASFPLNHAHVRFLIEFEKGHVARLEGGGLVRWVRHEETGGLPPGFGVEIEYLSEAARKDMIHFTDVLKLTPYIPSGPFPKTE